MFDPPLIVPNRETFFIELLGRRNGPIAGKLIAQVTGAVDFRLLRLLGYLNMTTTLVLTILESHGSGEQTQGLSGGTSDYKLTHFASQSTPLRRRISIRFSSYLEYPQKK